MFATGATGDQQSESGYIPGVTSLWAYFYSVQGIGWSTADQFCVTRGSCAHGWGVAVYRWKERHKAGKNEKISLNRSLIPLPLRDLIGQLVSDGFDRDDGIIQ